MALFGLGKKKEEKTTCGCSCGCGNAQETPVPAPAAGADGKLRSIKVLGSGCKSCRALLESTEGALRAMNSPLQAEYVTDMAQIAAYGVMSTPALVVNERVVSMGKVLSSAEVERLLRKLGY